MWITANENQKKKRQDSGPETWVHYSLKILETTPINIMHTEKEWETIHRIFQSPKCDPMAFPGHKNKELILCPISIQMIQTR